MTVIRSGEESLEGLYHRGELRPPVVIAAPHPRFGGSMDSAVVAEAAWSLTRAGHPTLRYNYRGVGASSGAWGEGEHDLDDLDAVVDQLVETTASPRVGLCGYSYGAWLALRYAARQTRVERLVLLSPPVDLLDVEGAVAALVAVRTLPLTVVVGSVDELAPLGRVRAAFAAAGSEWTLTVIADADHVFARGLPDVGRAAVEAMG